MVRICLNEKRLLFSATLDPAYILRAVTSILHYKLKCEKSRTAISQLLHPRLFTVFYSSTFIFMLSYNKVWRK